MSPDPADHTPGAWPLDHATEAAESSGGAGGAGGAAGASVQDRPTTVSGVAMPEVDDGAHGGGAGAGNGRGSGGGGDHGTGPSAGRRSVRWLTEWAAIVVIAVLVAFLVRTFVAQTYYIPSTSMYPTLKAGERIVVDKLAFDFGSIQRGDIVVFKRPPAEDCGGAPVPDLVKRVIGLPGNMISARNGTVYITGKPLKEPWLPHVSTTYTTNFGPVKVPAGDYFMMGDERKISCDSRMWGPVKRSYIVGKVDVIVWPLSAWRFFL